MRPIALPPRPGTTTQDGQSTVEFLVLALVLVPLFALVPMLGKYLDIAHATELAARYLAFESTIAHGAAGFKSEARLAAEVRTRFFGASDAPIESGEGRRAPTAALNPLWTDPDGTPLLDDPDTTVSIAVRRAGPLIPEGALLAGAHGLDLPMRNEHALQINVRLHDLEALPPFDRLGLEISRHQLILADGWATASPAAVAAGISSAGPLVYPIRSLKMLGETVGTLLPPLVLDPALAVDRVDPELVPCDRLPGACR
ncbi:hypothetical protein [Thauera phenolivorans]|uniref:hypothetical protein n=1 Tax=Thauera phenolivorans TaxID=1792543 RepID=UPI00083B1D7E|nr:hypothetical protein [Thauera phenolivorans]